MTDYQPTVIAREGVMDEEGDLVTTSLTVRIVDPDSGRQFQGYGVDEEIATADAVTRMGDILELEKRAEQERLEFAAQLARMEELAARLEAADN